MCACGNDDDDGARVIHVYYRSDKGEKKSTGEHAQTQMYVFKKNNTSHIIRFDRNRKKTKGKNGILNDGMAMYVECDEDDDERSPSFFFSHFLF